MDKTVTDVLDKNADRIAEAIGKLASTVERLAPELWRSSVRGYRTEGVVQLVMWLLLCVAAAFVARAFAREVRSDYPREGLCVFLGGVMCTLGLVVVASALFEGADAINKAFNPEWFAAWQLINTAVSR
jgi:hypothetical protein